MTQSASKFQFPLLSLPHPVLINVLGQLDDQSKCAAARTCSLLFDLACDQSIWPNALISDSIITESRLVLSKALCVPPQIFKVEIEYGRSKRFPVCVPLLNLRSILQEPDAIDLAARISQAVQEQLLQQERRHRSSRQLILVCRADRATVRFGFKNNLLVESILRWNEGLGWAPTGMSWLLLNRFDPTHLMQAEVLDYTQKVFAMLPEVEKESFLQEQQLRVQDRLALFYDVLLDYYIVSQNQVKRRGGGGGGDQKGIVRLQPQWFARAQLAESPIYLLSMAIQELETRVLDNTFAVEIGHNVVRMILHHPALARISHEQQSHRTIQRVIASTVDIFVCYYKLLSVAQTVSEFCQILQNPGFVQKRLGLGSYGLELSWTDPVIKRSGLHEAELSLCLRRLAEFVENERRVGENKTEIFSLTQEITQAVTEYSKGGKADSFGLGSCSITSEAVRVRNVFDQLSMNALLIDELDADSQSLVLRYRLQMEALRVLDWALMLLGAV
eukprot:TRINITY_DN2081_c0_g2_i1.p1 TRINITY_DN2081_c0_g2~~TRINITY_DN2081_c0_g2_i1.p1  ORF type:complete len:502 (-),score=36.64 TRINITY_DN2081_c0_g2_i1:866-2371(-)